jgi:phosphoribosylformylglycinamidine (FGAM) synthase-like enzyme
VTMEFKAPGDLVYVLGTTKDELGASEYYQMMNCVGFNVPEVDAEEVLPLYHALYQSIQDGLVASCHTIGRGGLGVHLAFSAIGGNLGARIDLRSVPVDEKLTDTQLLYSESAGRLLVTVDQEKREVFEKTLNGLGYACIGRVSKDPVLSVSGMDGKTIMSEGIGGLESAWKEPFGDLV